MKKAIITFLILTLLGGFGYYFFSEPVQPLGSAVTTILGTDKMSASRSVINTNFASLNSGKMEVSTTTLPLITTLSALDTVGALKSGSLTTGFTVINVAQGGTGASTLLSNQVLLGNGTSAINKVSGFGTAGQFLTSNGNGVAPSWQTSAIDTGIKYTWTDEHTFTASSSMLSLNLTDLWAVTATTTDFYNTNLTSTTGDITTLTSTTFTNSGTASTTDLVISGDQTGGSMTYTTSSTGFSVSSGTVTYTGVIPTNANIGMGKWAVTHSIDGSLGQGNVIIARSGLTSTIISVQNGATDDMVYTFSWSGANLVVTETTDATTYGSIAGTIYWYK